MPAPAHRRILLIGATGVFGSRLTRMLAGLAEVELILAARSIQPLEALRDELAGDARAYLTVQVFDRDRPEALAALRPWLVVDAAGPFQDSGYRLAAVAVASGAHYIDLADARGFVAGFPAALGEVAKRSGVLAVTGASSTPALSHAAATAITAGWRRIDDMTVAILPGARAPRGLAVVQAILSYVGQPLRVWNQGQWRMVAGWSNLRRIETPGLGRRWASLCETPDLDLLPQRFGVRDSALFMAGLELPVMHLGLSLFARPVRWGWIRSLRPLASPLRAIAGWLEPLGTDRGGMVVEAAGQDAGGQPIHARWALWAEAGAGPNTPAAPAAALVRALVEGRETRNGASPCVGLLGVNDIMAELAHLPICTRIDSGHPDSPILFRRLLGPRFDALPASVQAVHGGEQVRFEGHAIARAGRGPVARLLRRTLGLPPSGPCPSQVRLIGDRKGETWNRGFGNAVFRSRLADGVGLGLFEEHIGPLRFRFTLKPTASGVVWRLQGWSLLGLRLPLVLAPRIHAAGYDSSGRYRFRVAVAHPWTGLLFAYRGELA